MNLGPQGGVMSVSATSSCESACRYISGGRLRRLLFCLILAIAFSFLISISLSDVAQAAVNNNPGDQYVFGADSLVSPDSYDQSSLSINGNFVLWSEYDTSSFPGKHINYYKDLSKGPAEPKNALYSDDGAGGWPVYSQAAQRVLWTESFSNGVTPTTVYYKDVDLNTYAGCSGALDACATALPTTAGLYDPIVNLSLSPDGSKVAWRQGSDNYPQVYYYDFNTGLNQAVYNVSMHDQEQPSVDNEWIVWSENWNNNNFGWNNSAIYARRIGISGSPIQIAANDGSSNTQVLGAKISRNAAGEPMVAYISSNYMYGTSELRIHNLGNGVDQLFVAGNRFNMPYLDDNKVVYQDCGSGSCQIALYDLTSNTNQTVSQTAGGTYPVVSASSKYIAWPNRQSHPYQLYYNRIGDTAQGLANKYSPHLYFHHEEHFEPRKIDIMVAGEGTELKARNGGNFADKLIAAWPNLNLNTLSFYNSPDDRPGYPTGGKYIDLQPSVVEAFGSKAYFQNQYVNRYNGLVNQGAYPETAYAHIIKDASTGKSAIQYWLPYYFNNFANYHEGDWEHVDVMLNGDLQPIAAGYSEHDGGKKRLWQYTDGPDGHPIVYVGRGSHSNYFAAGDYPVLSIAGWDIATDHAELYGNIHSPNVEVLPSVSASNINGFLNSPYPWVAYQGAWSELSSLPGGDGPQGPAAAPEHDSIWDNPFAWFDGLCWDGFPPNICLTGPSLDVIGSVASPVDIHLYDAQGRHVGKNASGGIDKQISGAEYIEIPDVHRKSIVVHGGDGTAGYRFVLQGTGSGTFDFTIGSPDKAHNSSDTIQYLAVPVTASTQAQILLDQSKNYGLQVDANGDGKVITQRPPDSVTSQPVDLTPPANTTDLAVIGVNSSTATLSFTAPGDNGYAGTAQYYDIRYSATPIAESNWKDAMPVDQDPNPLPAGSKVTATATGLKAGTTYYFALKATDRALLSSGLSNVASTTTTIPNLTWSVQRIYWANWADYTNRQLSIDYKMGSSGTGTALASTVQASYCNPTSVYAVTVLPLLVGDLNPNAASTVTLKYYVPATVGSFTTKTYANCKDDAGRIYWFPGLLP